MSEGDRRDEVLPPLVRAWGPASQEIWPMAWEFAIARTLMSTLTRAELLSYPGETFTDKVLSQSYELGAQSKGLNASERGDVAVAPASERCRAIGRRVDIRRFPGRDRTERVMHYVRAHFPRAESWADDALREIAQGLLCSAEIIE
jgi:hypothetical protein